MKRTELKRLIREEIATTIKEALKFPAGKYDEQYKKLITAAQKQPKWDSKPYVNRTTATHEITGKINGEDVTFMWNSPGPYGANYAFKGMYNSTTEFTNPAFSKSGDAIDKFLIEEQKKIAKEKGISTRVPIVWLMAARNIPENLIKDNIKEFAEAIKSVS